ncbi:hypothetical protein SAMN05444394_0301 [Algoriphagus halophilus]|uniref:Sacsin/Nov domain-containing protein n=2 Tax=Algoriphagus halophilus TaxID=226505 RepID=A0A1N6D648_9BACT|nr:hypothetical protein SAMN05444394_0301 [Algoriphagus halophilus]
MIARAKALQILKDYWGTSELVFQADFLIPKNITLREGTKPFGYFMNFRLNGEVIDYPPEARNERRLSIKYPIKDGLKEKQRYEVKVELSEDKYRVTNPFSLRVTEFKEIQASVSQNQDSSLEAAIKEIFEENLTINSPFQVVNLANSVESLATDIYSENKRFIYELIQNADDAALDENAELSIQILENYVVISHNGAPFNSRDIRGLCSIGIGTKTDDASKTGYKGIGFKSVFGQPDGIVYVKTANTLFRFDRDYVEKKGWNSKWGDQEAWEKKHNVQFHCPWQMMPILSNRIDDSEAAQILNDENFTVKTAIKIRDGKRLYKDIISLFEDAKFMLFLRKIKSVKLVRNDNIISLEKVKNEEDSNQVSLFKNDKLLSNWYVISWIHDIPAEIRKELKSDIKTPKKIQDMEKTEISFAIQLNGQKTEIELLKENESPIYTYLPTSEKEFNFPFIVNSNFLLDAGREKIHKNRIWNEWLFQVIGYKTVECCAHFAQKKIFESSYLSLFRNGFYTQTDNLRIKLNLGLEFGFEKHPFIRNRKDELSRLLDVCFDPYDLNSVDPIINEKIAGFLSVSEDGFQIESKNLIPQTDSNKILKKFNPKELSELQLQNFFSSESLRKSISLENNLKILEFLKSFEEKDPSGKWYSVVTNHKLIVNNDGNLDYITGVCFPMRISSPIGDQYKNRLIHQKVYDEINDPDFISWLKKLGVTEPGEIAYLEKEIIGRIDSCINGVNFLEITSFIFDLHLSGKLTQNHYISLQELPLKTNHGFKKANECVLPEEYNPTIDFSKVIRNTNSVVKEYLEIGTPQDCRVFFKALNVIDDIDFIKSAKRSSSELPLAYVNGAYTFSKDGHVYPHLVGVYYVGPLNQGVPFFIQTFSFFDQVTSSSIAELFWERLFIKFHIKRDKSGELGDGYEKKKPYTEYSLGNGHFLRTLDKMKWGRYPNNETYTLGYFFWRIENVSCLPTSCGMKIPKEAFVNSDYNKELAGDYLPIVTLKDQIPEDWRKILNLRTKFSLSDLLSVLDQIAQEVSSKGKLDRENQKRIGLIYNEIFQQIENNEEISLSEIEEWGKNHCLVSSSFKSIIPKELLWIKVPGFENVSIGIETIFLPPNLDKRNSAFEPFLEAFGVRIIEDFSVEADNQNEFYDLKIKLLKLIGPIGLLLRQRMQTSNLDKFIYERYERISKTKFIKCSNLRPVFFHGSEKIEGEGISYCYEKNKDEFLLTFNWANPISLLNISHELSLLISATKVEKELMVLLGLSDLQVSEFLKSIKLNPEDYQKCSSYQDILKLIEELEKKSRPSISPNLKAVQPIPEPLPQKELDEDYVSNEKIESPTVHKIKKLEYDDDEIAQIKKLFGRELEDSELEEENLFAQVKALRYFKNQGYDISQAEAQFKQNYEDKFIYPIIDQRGVAFKVMCRSARRGVLFLGGYAWVSLKNEDTILYILTGDVSTDCILIKTQEELEKKLNSYFKVIRRINSTIEDLRTIIEAETELSDLQLLYRAKEGPFDVIFNPQQNKPGETEGPLTDIGIDI